LKEVPTVLDDIKCNTPNCSLSTKSCSVSFITIRISNGDLNSLEKDFKKRLLVENSTCDHRKNKEKKRRGIKTIQPSLSLMHLFIGLLNCEDIVNENLNN
jgi:hypothetical protein